MKKRIIKLSFVLIAIVGVCPFASAQSGGVYRKSAEELKADANDSVIIATVVDPQVTASTSNGEAPDWEAIKANVALKYDGTAADRAITKKRIYFYYYKDWSLFSTAIVHYTQAYENKDNFKVMNINAKYVLQYSQNPTEWKTAQGWVKHAMDKDPSNATYKETYDALEAKIKG